jgi:hypothetical protein
LTVTQNPLLAAAAEVRAAATGSLPTSEIGSVLPERQFTSGLVPGWTLFEAQARIIPVAKLKWPVSIVTYEDMRRDPQIQGLLQSFWLPIRQYEWYVDPAGTTGTVAEEIAQDFGLPLFGEENPDETRGLDFDDHIRIALVATATGHKIFEEAGELDEQGKFRLTRLEQRPETTISRFNIAPNGDLISVQQYGSVPAPTIPAERLLTYVWDREGANWAGRPLLYGLYRPWLLKDELVRGDAVTHRRFSGVPYTKQTQPGVVDSGASAAAAAAMQALRAGDTSGIHFPYGIEPGILSGDGSSSAINSAEYHDRQMSRAFMQMFADLGTTPHGSRALGTTLLDHFTLGVITVANWVRKSTMLAVRREVTRNYGPEAKAPEIKFREERAQELTPEQLVALVEAGVIVADDDLEKAVRENGSLPQRNKSEKARPVPGKNLTIDNTEIAASAPEPGTQAAESKTDFQGLQRSHQATLANLTAMWAGVQAAQILDLTSQIRNAADVAALAALTPTVIGGVQLAKALEPVVEHGAQTVIDSAAAQGHTLATPDLTGAHATIANAAEATATVLAQALGQSAASKATGLAGGGLSNDDIASQVADYLHGLSGATPEYELTGLISQAQNEGRFTAMEDAPDGARFYASEVNDSNTCLPCDHEDGDGFTSIAEARRDYPAGGYVACEGGKRCRGTVVMVLAETPGQA